MSVVGQLMIVERDPAGIATVALNRPEARNALNRALVAELRGVVERLAADDGLRAVILTGMGDRAFCAGADLVERRTMTADQRTATTEGILDVVNGFAGLPVPVIGALNGFALAGGAELALACDLRFGVPETAVGFPEVKIGIFPGAGGVARLPRLIGPSAAADLLFTGRQVRADEAFRLGLIDALVPADELLLAARATAEAIAENAPLAVRALKLAMRESEGLPLDQALTAIGRHRRPLDATRDYAEGLAAFAEKRAPRFEGR
jgi:enoyl-CoA hydratase/carnithine racemase